MIEILHLVPSHAPAYEFGGTITAQESLFNSLNSDPTIRQIVLSTRHSSKKRIFKNVDLPQLKIYYLNGISLLNSYISISYLMKTILFVRKTKNIHVHGFWNLTVMTSLIIISFFSKKSTRKILTPHGMLSEYTFCHKKVILKKIIFKIFQRELKNFIIHVSSTQEYEEIKKILPNSRIVLLPNFQDLSMYEDRGEKIEDKNFNILFLGRIHEKKGIERIFDLLERINLDNIHFRIVGEGEKKYVEKIKTFYKNIFGKYRIELIPWANKDQCVEFYQNSDLFILLSNNENFGMTIIESALCGTPVLTSSNVGSSEILRDIPECAIVQIDDTQRIDQIVHFLYNKRKRVSKESRNKIREYFDKTNLKNKYKQRLYTESYV